MKLGRVSSLKELDELLNSLDLDQPCPKSADGPRGGRDTSDVLICRMVGWIRRLLKTTSEPRMNRLQMGAEMSQMKVHAGSIELGGERAAVIVPLMGKNTSELAHKARTVAGSGADLVEWRVDHLSDISNPVITGCAQVLRREVSLPILATFRTEGQGGRGEVADYERVALAVLEAKAADLLDVEYSLEQPRRVVLSAFEAEAPVVLSRHDFRVTPSADEIIASLRQMQGELLE